MKPQEYGELDGNRQRIAPDALVSLSAGDLLDIVAHCSGSKDPVSSFAEFLLLEVSPWTSLVQKAMGYLGDVADNVVEDVMDVADPVLDAGPVGSKVDVVACSKVRVLMKMSREHLLDG